MHLMTPTDHGHGVTLWTCAACGRRFLLSLNPYRKTVLIAGDVSAAHTGGTGGLKIEAMEVEQ